MQLFGEMYNDLDISKIKCIISIDIGHGECAAACVTDFRAALGAKYMDLLLTPSNDTVVHTAIYAGTQEEPVISRKVAHVLAAYFKDRPDLLVEKPETGPYQTKREAMLAFLETLSNNLRTLNPSCFHTKEGEEILLEETLLYIGCPSDSAWLSEREEYAALITEATGFPNVVIIPESRAAVHEKLSAKQKEEVSAKELEHGFVVFDLGSLTADCTYISASGGSFEFSWNLGASEIERNMLKQALEEHSLSEKDPLHFLDILMDCRAEKEVYFTCSSDARKRSVTFEAENGKYYTFVFSQDDMTRATHEQSISVPQRMGSPLTGSWAELCKLFFEHARKRLPEDRRNDVTVILTGGASNMQFVQQICLNVFDEATVLKVIQPSFSVSHGLCDAACRDREALLAFGDVLKRVNEAVEESCKCFSELWASHIIEKAYKPLLECVKMWSEEDADRSVLDLMDAFSPKLQCIMNKESVAFDRYYNDLLDSIAASIVDVVNTCLASVYFGSISGSSVALRHDDGITAGIKGAILSSTSSDTNAITDAVRKQIHECSMIAMVAGVMGSILLKVAGILGGIYDALVEILDIDSEVGQTFWDWGNKLKDYVLRNPDVTKKLSKRKRNDSFKRIKDKESFCTDLKSKVAEQIAASLQRQMQANRFDEVVRKALEDAIDRITLSCIA